MNVQRYLISTCALFVFVFLYQFLVHDYILIGMYEATAHVWRSLEQMQANIPLALCLQFALSAVIAFAFSQFYKDGGIQNGLLFGLIFGTFAGILTASWYLWLPISATLGWIWFISAILEGIGGGLILGITYKK